MIVMMHLSLDHSIGTITESTALHQLHLTDGNVQLDNIQC